MLAKNLMIIFATISITSLSIPQAFSKTEPQFQQGSETQLPSCDDTPESSEVGTVCRTLTSKWSRVFVNEMYGWKDARGITWYDYTKSHMSESVSETFCKMNDLTLPTNEDFERAEVHGLRQVLKSVRSKRLWSSSQYDQTLYEDTSYSFNGVYGRIESGYNSYQLDNFARCVSH